MKLATFADELAAIGDALSQAEIMPAPQPEEPPRARSVDCGSCTACCHLGVYLLPWDDAATYETEADGKLLKRRADGACVYLGASGCTIYERRPLACRAFHCGIFAARLKPEERAEHIAKAEAIGNRQFARVLAEGDKRKDGLST